MKKQGHFKETNISLIVHKSAILSKERVRFEMKKLGNKNGTGKNNKLVLADLAKICGYSEAYFRKMFGKKMPYDACKKLADYFGVTVEYLCGFEDARTAKESKSIKRDKERKHIQALINYLGVIGYDVNLVAYDFDLSTEYETRMTLNDLSMSDIKQGTKTCIINNKHIDICFKLRHKSTDGKKLISYIPVVDALTFFNKMDALTCDLVSNFLIN